METMPLAYEDFSDNLLTTVSTLQRDSFSTVYSWSMCHLDTIIPNKIYYYMVRSVDIHGHKSYPSSVYKVRMINDSGAIYPLVEVIDMDGMVVDSALGKEDNITLGIISPKLFGNSSYGQTFKIRLISKNTGKKIDLNVTFKVENEL